MSGLMRGLEESYVCVYLTQILNGHWVAAKADRIQHTAYVHDIVLLYSHGKTKIDEASRLSVTE